MSKACLSFTAAFAVVLVASVAQAGQSWQGAQVMPSSAEVSLQADDGSTTSLYDISWPATVTKTKGRFLWVQDDGGYSRTQAGGWVYCDDVVRLDGASEHFSSELRSASRPGSTGCAAFVGKARASPALPSPIIKAPCGSSRIRHWTTCISASDACLPKSKCSTAAANMIPRCERFGRGTSKPRKPSIPIVRSCITNGASL